MITYDPGVGGGFAWKAIGGDICAAPMPELPAKSKTDVWSRHQIESLRKLTHLILGTTDHNSTIYIEHIGPRPSDTPKTAYRLSANYHIALTLLGLSGREVKMVRPLHWQNQLPMLVPSGSHNYQARKKVFYKFAHLKYPELHQVRIKKPLEESSQFIQHNSKPTFKTADALCMLWVYSGDL